jgi:hypothetical protein
MTTTPKYLLLLACGWSLGACAGAKKDPPPASPPVPPNGKFDPMTGAPGAPTPAELEEKKKQEMAASINRGIKKEEFALTLIADDPSVAQIESINIDVISATSVEISKLESVGPVKYRDSRQTGANTRSHVFRKGGRLVVNVPTIPAADTVLLWAELAAPASGNDSRMLVVPLALDKSDPAKGAVANPITVKLTASGWVRVN